MSLLQSMTEPYVVRRGRGIPLLCVHGNGVDHRLLLALDDALAESGSWERIYLDLPGFGETPPLAGRGGLPDYVDWLDNAVTELIGTTPFAVLGNSMGGLLARALAARRLRQCLGLAMLAPIVDPVRENRTLPGREVLREDHALLRSLDPEDAETYAEMAVTQSRQNWQRFQRSALPGIRAADTEAMERLGELYELPESPDDKLAGLERPMLIVTGKQDFIAGYEDQWMLSKRLQRCSYAVLDGAGHNVHLDQPYAVEELLRGWARLVSNDADETEPCHSAPPDDLHAHGGVEDAAIAATDSHEPRVVAYRPVHREALLALSLRAWSPVFPLTRADVPGFVYETFYPDGWEARQCADLATVLEQEPESIDVAVMRDEPVGWVCTRLHPADAMAEIYVLAVDPAHQRSGIGRLLMTSAFGRGRSAGMRMIMVETGGDAGHAPARELYETEGFVRWPVARYFKDLGR